MSPSKDDSVELPNSSISKMAVKGFSLAPKAGGKPLSFATKAVSKPPSSSPPGKRPRAALNDASEDEDEKIVRHEAVTGFDIREGGALRKDAEIKNGPLVIPKLKTRNWREEIRHHRQKGKNLLPPEVQAQRRWGGAVAAEAKDTTNKEGEAQWGLTITKKSGTDEQSNNNAEVQVLNVTTKDEVESSKEALAERPRERTDDEIAIEALIGAKSEKKGPDLVITAVGSKVDTTYSSRVTEEDAYRNAIRSAPDVSTLEDYERVPVEEFGAALLRGMGWKEGDAKKGRVERPKEVKRRQNLLGLGATELKGAEELGAWVQKSDPKRLSVRNNRGGGERRPRANEYKEREERRRESRDERFGGSHRRDRDEYRERDRDRDRRR